MSAAALLPEDDQPLRIRTVAEWLVEGIAQLAAILPSSIASPNFGKPRPNVGKPVQTANVNESEEDAVLRGETPVLAMSFPTWESAKLVPEGGLEPPCG